MFWLKCVKMMKLPWSRLGSSKDRLWSWSKLRFRCKVVPAPWGSFGPRSSPTLQPAAPHSAVHTQTHTCTWMHTRKDRQSCSWTRQTLQYGTYLVSSVFSHLNDWILLFEKTLNFLALSLKKWIFSMAGMLMTLCLKELSVLVSPAAHYCRLCGNVSTLSAQGEGGGRSFQIGPVWNHSHSPWRGWVCRWGTQVRAQEFDTTTRPLTLTENSQTPHSPESARGACSAYSDPPPEDREACKRSVILKLWSSGSSAISFIFRGNAY